LNGGLVGVNHHQRRAAQKAGSSCQLSPRSSEEKSIGGRVPARTLPGCARVVAGDLIS
jgi:hypothetical protein